MESEISLISMQLRWAMIYGSFVGSSFLNVRIESPAPAIAAIELGRQSKQRKMIEDSY